jgi:hypothetical protein
LVARFPRLPDDAGTLEFRSATLGGLQDEWGGHGIELPEIPVYPKKQ